MVVKMMKWKFSSKKFDAKITVHQLRGIQLSSQFSRFSVEIKWKGSKGTGLSSLRRRSVRRNFTKEESLKGDDGVIEWNEQFQSSCTFSCYKDGVFHPWEVSFTVFSGLSEGPNNKIPILGSVSLNLSEYASEKKGKEITIPLVDGASLHLSIILLELINAEERSEPVPRPVLLFPRSPCYGEAASSSTEKEEIPTRKTSPIKVNIFKGFSSFRAKRSSHEEEISDGRSDVRSELNCQIDTDSLDESEEEVELEEIKEQDDDSATRKSFTYGTLAYVNHAGAGIIPNTCSSEDEDLIYFSHRKSDVGQRYRSDTDLLEQEKSTLGNSKRRFLPWRKRKLGFKSPKVKGEPLLKKDNEEEGGDDIDFDRRVLSSSDESTLGKQQKTGENSATSRPSDSGFGDDNFAIGAWESKEIISRDGHMKLKTQVFFASIDQRSERAAGESACTALVAVIAYWLQINHDEMPIKSQLDTLIREGSLEWRNLCENETYQERFPDKHFDLETVLEAKVRPLSIASEKSFVGFFHPEGLEEDGCFDFLKEAMSFDNIWDEISKNTENTPFVYIISWNDHFFVLKVDQDAYYIIDTLGERLFEGCNEAYILKFNKDTLIEKNDVEKDGKKRKENKAEEGPHENGQVSSSDESTVNDEEDESRIVCSGKESCKEYIKSFLAAIPIRELQVDLKKGLTCSAPLHQRLQIEFHYSKCLDSIEEHQLAEEMDEKPVTLQPAVLESE